MKQYLSYSFLLHPFLCFLDLPMTDTRTNLEYGSRQQAIMYPFLEQFSFLVYRQGIDVLLSESHLFPPLFLQFENGDFSKDRLIDEGKHTYTVRKNGKILKKLIDAISLLGRQGFPFRGPDESDNWQ